MESMGFRVTHLYGLTESYGPATLCAWQEEWGELDLNARGMGMRCQRFSMLVDDGVVKSLNVEAPGKFEVSDGDTMVKQA